MTSLTKTLSALVLSAAVMTAASSAEAWDGHYYDHHNHSHISFGINIGGPAYYPYYAPNVMYVPPPQVVYTAPVVETVAPLQASEYCREYNTRIMTPHGPRIAYGTACLQPDGQWHVAN